MSVGARRAANALGEFEPKSLAMMRAWTLDEVARKSDGMLDESYRIVRDDPDSVVMFESASRRTLSVYIADPRPMIVAIGRVFDRPVVRVEPLAMSNMTEALE